jgi:hypothetical protein
MQGDRREWAERRHRLFETLARLVRVRRVRRRRGVPFRLLLQVRLVPTDQVADHRAGQVEVATEATAGTRLVDRDDVAIQEHVKLSGVPGVARPGLGVLDGLGAPLPGSGVDALSLGAAAGGTSAVAVAVRHEAIA